MRNFSLILILLVLLVSGTSEEEKGEKLRLNLRDLF